MSTALRKPWPEVAIGECCTIRPNKREVKKTLTDDAEVGFVPMADLGIRCQSIAVQQSKPLSEVYGGYTYFADDDVVLAKVTPCFQNGKLGIARDLPNGVGFGSSEFFVLRCGETITPEWLLYFLSQDEFIRGGVQRMGGAAGLQRVPTDYLAESMIPLPPLAEQKRIVAVLDEAFAAIDAAEAGVRQKTAELDVLVQARTRHLLISSKTGETVELGEVLRLRRGFDITKKHQRPGVVPIVSSGGASSTHDEAMAEGPGVVVGRKGSIGTVHYVTTDFWPHDTTLFVEDFLGNHPRYAFHLLRSLDLKSLDTGAANPSLNRNLVHPLPVAAIAPAEQELLASEIDLIQTTTDDLLDLCARKLAALDELRRSLLHRAFTGRLTAGGDTP